MDLRATPPSEAIQVQRAEPIPRILGPGGVPLGPQRFKFFGQGFPLNQNDICVLFPAGSDLHLPMPVIGVPTPNCLIVEMPPLPPGTQPAAPFIMAGEGIQMPWDPVFDDLWAAWAANAFRGRGAGTPTPDELDPDDDAPPPNVRWLFGRVRDNAICLPLDADWGPNVCVDLRGHVEVLFPGDNQPHHFDFSIPRTIFRASGTLEDCAARIQDMLRCVLAQLLGLQPGQVDIQIEPDPNGGVKLTIRFVDAAGNEGQIGAAGWQQCAWRCCIGSRYG